MSSTRQRIIETLDKSFDWCIENWRAMVVLLPAGTFVFFTVVLFFGLTVNASLALTKVAVVFQLIAIGVILALHLKYRGQSRRWLDAADAIEAMITKDDAFSDWDYFIAEPSGDPAIERIRLHCLTLPKDFPPVAPGDYCNQYGIEILQGHVQRLRSGLATRAMTAFARFRSARRARRLSSMDWPEDPAGDGFEGLGNMPGTVEDPVPETPMRFEPRETGIPVTTLPDEPAAPAAKKTAKRKAAAKKTTTKKKAAKKKTARKSARKSTAKRKTSAKTQGRRVA